MLCLRPLPNQAQMCHAVSRGMERLSVALRIRFAEKSRINGSLHLQGSVREDPYRSPPLFNLGLRKKKPREVGFKRLAESDFTQDLQRCVKTTLFTRTHTRRTMTSSTDTLVQDPETRKLRLIKYLHAPKFYEQYVTSLFTFIFIHLQMLLCKYMQASATHTALKGFFYAI